MKPVDRINSQIHDLMQLKTLAAGSGQLNQEILAQKIDTDHDGSLSESELNQAGFQDNNLRNELKVLYQNGSAAPNLPLFEGPQLDRRIEKLQARRSEIVTQTETSLKGKVECFTRLLFNHFDDNDDSSLDIAEIGKIDSKELRKLAKEFVVDFADAQKILAQLQTLASARRAQISEGTPSKSGKQPETEVILTPSTEKDFASGMRFEGDPVDDAIEAARKGSQKAKFQMEFLQHAGKTTENQSFLTALARHSLLTQENLFYLTQISKEQTPETLRQLTQSLETYLAGPAKGHVIKMGERPAFVQALLRDIAFPEDIDQGEKGTCGANAIQIEVSRRDPVKYLDMALSLAKNQAYSLLPTVAGVPRTLHPNTTFRGDRGDDRSLSAKLVQNAFMDLGHQAGENDLHYIHKGKAIYFDSRMSIDTAQGLDESKVLSQAAKKYPELKGVKAPVLARLGDGVSEREIEHVAQGFFGNQWNDLATVTSSKEEMMAGLDQALAQGKEVTVGSEDHAMTVLAKKQEKGRTLYQVASWSGHYTMTPDALKQRLTNVFVDRP